MTFETFTKQAGVSVKLKTGIEEISGSKLSWNIDHPNLGFSHFSSVHPNKCWSSTSNKPWHCLPNVFQFIFILPINTIYFAILTLL
jgi:hypothetical protein